MFRLRDFRKENKLTQKDIADAFDCGQSNIVAIEKDGKDLTEEQLSRLISGFGEDYVMSFYKNDEDEQSGKNSDLIPFYDIETYGGINDYSADVETAVAIPTSYIKAGEWFGKKITQAIRHYGDSMAEYPSGCILALKIITDIDEIVWGRNYVIETHQNRVTKRLQTCEDEDYVMAYSSNTETYPDGKQIHEPFRIKKENIRHIFLVIGMISKEESSSLMNAAG